MTLLAETELYTIEAMLGGVDEVTEEQLGCRFDELSAIVAMQPDDALAFTAVRELVIEARDRGYVNQAMQMAMTLGAMACTHNHLQSLASEVGDSIFSRTDRHDNHDHKSDRRDTNHDTKTCPDCKVGKPCRRKR